MTSAFSRLPIVLLIQSLQQRYIFMMAISCLMEKPEFWLVEQRHSLKSKKRHLLCLKELAYNY